MLVPNALPVTAISACSSDLCGDNGRNDICCGKIMFISGTANKHLRETPHCLLKSQS
jgi:hypothetical protein